MSRIVRHRILRGARFGWLAVCVVLLAGCGGSQSSSVPCAHGKDAVSARAGAYDVALEISPPEGSPPAVRLPGMAGATATHVDIEVCRAGASRVLAVALQATVVDRSSETRARLPLTRHGADRHFAANVNLAHHAAVELAFRGKRLTLIPPTD